MPRKKDTVVVAAQPELQQQQQPPPQQPQQHQGIPPNAVMAAPAAVPAQQQPPPMQMLPRQQPQPQQAPAAPPTTVTIDAQAYNRVRQSVFDRFQTINNLITEFSQGVARELAGLIGEHPDFAQHGMVNFQIAQPMQFPVAPAPQPVVAAVVDDKKRKKRNHDPNAPKRPLTAYFLYLQHARQIIANDLGENAPKGAVQDEGLRRWNSMSPAEKAGWTNAYAYSLRLYNARVDSYRKGNIHAKDMTDAEATIYADHHGIGMPPLTDLGHGGNGDSHQDLVDQGIPEMLMEPEPEPEPLAEPELEELEEEEHAVVPTPKKPARKRKGADAEAPGPVSPANKKARRTNKAAGEEAPEAKKPSRKRATKA
jgi:hypothetical protein